MYTYQYMLIAVRHASCKPLIYPAVNTGDTLVANIFYKQPPPRLDILYVVLTYKMFKGQIKIFLYFTNRTKYANRYDEMFSLDKPCLVGCLSQHPVAFTSDQINAMNSIYYVSLFKHTCNTIKDDTSMLII